MYMITKYYITNGKNYSIIIILLYNYNNNNSGNFIKWIFRLYIQFIANLT